MFDNADQSKSEARRQHLSAAYDIATGLLDGSSSLAGIEKQVKALGKPCLEGRLKGLSAQWGNLDVAANEGRLAALVARMAAGPDGEPLPFDVFAARLEEEVAGLVFTAHPTFSFSDSAWTYARAYLGALADGEAAAEAATAHVQVDAVEPTRSPTLHEELEYAAVAVGNTRRAIRRLYGIIFDTASELYPEEYRALRPRLATVASWVGFDLDGRTDIDWSLGLLFRYRSAIAGLDECLGLARALKFAGADTMRDWAVIRAGFEDLRDCFTIGARALEDHKDSPTGLGKLNQVAIENKARKEDAAKRINTAFEALLGQPLGHAEWRGAATLYSEWRAIGLGLSHIHFRLNAAQLHNAIGPEIHLTKSPDQSAMRRHFLAAISEKLDGVSARSIHYGTLSREQTTAKRVFMMAAQFKKHFDSETKIRMLVAESDTPFTLLTALYYARLFGVDDYVEISPLFETAVGLERGDRVIAELIDNPHFLAYIRKQGRFCLQLGFSDSGRYIGQPAATLAIERFKIRLVRLWKARGLGDVQLLFFDTHGESIGRGAYPFSLRERFLYTHSPRVREALATLERPEKHEVSFQGGEGFLWFLAESTAFATLTDFLEVRFGGYSTEGDRLYEEKGWSLDFFLTLVEYQNHLTDHKGYIRLIDSIGRSLLFPTGSRSLRRQGAGAVHQRLERISQIRAIPNNAVLQQLGYLANSCAGFGTAISRSPDQFNAIHANSDRLRMVTNLAVAALRRSDVGVIEAYSKLLTPGYWLDRADGSGELEHRAQLRRLSRLMEGMFDADAVEACIRKLRRDAGMLTDALSENSPAAFDMTEDSELAALHQLRIGLIQFIFLKAMEIPRFSTRFDFSLEELLVELLHLEVPDTVAQLRRIFPEAPLQKDDEVYGEETTYEGGSSAGYEEVHRNILDKLELAYSLVLDISGLIALKAGAFG